MKFTLFLFILITISDKKISKTPIKNNAVTIKEICTIVDEEDGFYQSIDTALSPDGKVVILDRGNFLIHIYDLTGKHIRSFGKEGNGPGELTQAGSIDAYEDYILLKNFDRIMIFDYNGELINEIKEEFFSGLYQKTDQGFRYIFNQSANPKFFMKSFDLKGNLLEEQVNPEYKPFDFKNRPDMETRMKENFKKAISFVPYGDHFVQYYQGSYKFQISDITGKAIHTITRDFTRIKQEEDNSVRFFTSKDATKKMKERIAKMQAQSAAIRSSLTNGYKNDISEIVGIIDGFIFLRIASEKEKSFKMDVINSDLELYTTVEFEHEDLEWATIVDGKFLMELNNDDVGPYVKVFDLKIL